MPRKTTWRTLEYREKYHHRQERKTVELRKNRVRGGFLDSFTQFSFTQSIFASQISLNNIRANAISQSL
jgi:hypothetical protein